MASWTGTDGSGGRQFENVEVEMPKSAEEGDEVEEEELKGDGSCCNFENEDNEAEGSIEEVEDESSLILLLVVISKDSIMSIFCRCNPACGIVIVPR